MTLTVDAPKNKNKININKQTFNPINFTDLTNLHLPACSLDLLGFFSFDNKT